MNNSVAVEESKVTQECKHKTEEPNKNKYYVYVHKDLNGKIFYVGKGINKRATSSGSRSVAWKEIADKGYTYEILHSGLTNKEAFALEAETIVKHRETIVNDKSSKITRTLVLEELQDIFYYDETSPSGLRWKADRLKNRGAKLFSAGDVAGNKKFLPNGVPRCWRLKYKGSPVMIHRIIWVLLHGELDTDMVIDHLDGDAFNNNISNLKPKTAADNSRNRKYKLWGTGVVGVILRKSPSGTDYYRATWTNEQGISVSKHFCVKKNGKDKAFQLACDHRLNALKELQQKGIDYTDRHIFQ